MIKILFICHGNICRSTTAQWVFTEIVRKKGMESQFYIDSAATSREEIGNPIYPPAKRKLEEKGVPVGEHRSVQVTKTDYDKYDYLIIMDNRNRNMLSRIIPDDPDKKIHTLMSFTGNDREIADPWYTGDFETAYREIEAGCKAFLSYCEERMSTGSI